MISDNVKSSFKRVDKIKWSFSEISNILSSLKLIIRSKPTLNEVEKYMKLFPEIFKPSLNISSYIKYMISNEIIVILNGDYNVQYVYEGEKSHLLSCVDLYIVTKGDVDLYIKYGSSGYTKRFYDTYGIEPSLCNKLKKVENCANKVSIFEYPMYKIEILVEKALGY